MSVIKNFQNESDFKIQEPLGRGSFGFVNKIQFLKPELINQFGRFAALKQNFDSRIDVQKEFEALKAVSHECQCDNIIKFYGETKVWNNFAYILELADLGTLEEFIPLSKMALRTQKEKKLAQLREKFKTKSLIKLLKQLANGLNYMHRKNYVHIDLKPDNVLLSSDGGPLNDEFSDFPVVVKLTDFGLSKRNETSIMENCTTTVKDGGNACYKAPEQYFGIIDEKHQNIIRSMEYERKKVDTFAFGGIVYTLITCNRPNKNALMFINFFQNLNSDTSSELHNISVAPEEEKLITEIFPVKPGELNGFGIGLHEILFVCCRVINSNRISLENIEPKLAWLSLFNSELDLHLHNIYSGKEIFKRTRNFVASINSTNVGIENEKIRKANSQQVSGTVELSIASTKESDSLWEEWGEVDQDAGIRKMNDNGTPIDYNTEFYAQFLPEVKQENSENDENDDDVFPSENVKF